MKRSLALAAVLTLVLAAGALLAADAPSKLVFEAKNGAVTFDHAKHVERAKGDCKACHPGLWEQKKGDLGYKAGMHKKAESEKTSCASCHVAGGKAFESKGNCATCHTKK